MRVLTRIEVKKVSGGGIGFVPGEVPPPSSWVPPAGLDSINVRVFPTGFGMTFGSGMIGYGGYQSYGGGGHSGIINDS